MCQLEGLVWLLAGVEAVGVMHAWTIAPPMHTNTRLPGGAHTYSYMLPDEPSQPVCVADDPRPLCRPLSLCTHT